MADKKIIPVGPFMPLLEEPEYFRLHVDGEKVIDVELDIGYNHRGIEKLCEEKTYDQIAFVVERICGICSTSHPTAYVQAVEDVADIPVPPRALYIRTVVAELERLCDLCHRSRLATADAKTSVSVNLVRSVK